jgi:hypothetical protein
MTDEIGTPLYALFQAVGLVMSIAILFFSLRGLASMPSSEIIFSALVSSATNVLSSVVSGVLALV